MKIKRPYLRCKKCKKNFTNWDDVKFDETENEPICPLCGERLITRDWGRIDE